MLNPIDIDIAFERAMCDHWWVQNKAVVIRRPEIEYMKSERDRRLYNAVVRVSPHCSDPERLVSEVMTAHSGKGSEWRIGYPSHTPQLEQAVLNAGYNLEAMADAWTLDTSARRPPLPNDIRIERVETLQHMRDGETVQAKSFEDHKGRSDADLLQDLSLFVGDHARALRFIAYDAHSGEPLSSGGINFYPNLPITFMWAGCTVPHARGRGIYSAIVTRRLREAKLRGAEKIGLYAMRETSGPIVAAQGFEKHGPVYFWGRDKVI